jgi:hypothetical protein
MIDTLFRDLMNRLLLSRRHCPDWPQQFLWLVETTLGKEQETCRQYRGDGILIDRAQLPVPKKAGEKRAAYGLYRQCHAPTRHGLLGINDDLF